MRILLSNDDGILAPGLAAMYREILTLGEVVVAAPESMQSATAHSITVDAPLAVSNVIVPDLFTGYGVAGRPADCVKLAIRELCSQRPDLVISGINDGANVSINVLYSGTVAAAAEGALFGIPAFAVSLEHGENLDFARAAKIARRIIDHCLDQGVSGSQLININVPQLVGDRPVGVRVAPMSTQTMDDRYVKVREPDGKDYYWLKGEWAETSVKESDLHALNEGYVVITPLQFDLTQQRQLAEMESWSWPPVEEG